MFENIILYQNGKDEMYNVWHKNENNTFLYVHSGEGSIVFSNRIYPLKKGILCYIPSQKQHYTLPQNPVEYTRSKISISDSLSTKLITHNAHHMIPQTRAIVYAEIPKSEQPNIELIWRLLEKSQIGEIDKTTFYSGCILHLLSYLNTYKTNKIKVLDNSIEMALDYINLHISSPLNVDAICSAANMSKYYFCHNFKKILGVSVMKYVLNTRLSLAKEMLILEKYSINEISDLCGFENASNFCHLFKKHIGITAMQYRKNNQ